MRKLDVRETLQVPQQFNRNPQWIKKKISTGIFYKNEIALFTHDQMQADLLMNLVGCIITVVWK